MKRTLIVVAIMVAVIGLWLAWRGSGIEVYRFSDVAGPSEATPITVPPATRLDAYDRGGPNRLAVLVTDPSSDWIGLVRGFKVHGIPFTMTSDPARAMRHDVVLAYPSISGRLLPADALRGLADHVRGGGTVITFDLAGGGLEEVFGIASQTASRARSEIRWQGQGAADSLTRFSGARAEAKEGSYGLQITTATRFASFDDGTAAAVCRRAGGNACILGVDMGSLTQRAMNGRAEQVSPASVNTYEPSLDLMYRWIRDRYVEGEDQPYLIGTAPSGKEGSLILTHDVDYTRSVTNAPVYADAIRRRNLSATFFIQTKVIRDWNDDVFFNDANLPALRKTAVGMEIGSHSVSHSRAFAAFPPGDGTESYPDYRPFVKNKTRTDGGTVLGELRVSRFLLETMLNVPIRSFRPGYLADPAELPEALAATRYRYASTLTANIALTHYPFQLTQSRAGTALIPVWEFPVTIEDERGARLNDQFDAAVGVIDKVARNGGMAVVLIHPDVTGQKLRFEERLMDHYLNRLWIGPLAQFGDWWSARDGAEVDFDDGEVTLRSTAAISDLVILFPKSGKSVVLNGGPGVHRVAAD